METPTTDRAEITGHVGEGEIGRRWKKEHCGSHRREADPTDGGPSIHLPQLALLQALGKTGWRNLRECGDESERSGAEGHDIAQSRMVKVTGRGRVIRVGKPEPNGRETHWRIRMIKIFVAWAVLSVFLFVGTSAADHWPKWRGPDDNGVSDETGLASEWTQTENISWRLALPGPGPATPIVWGDRIFLTSSEGESLVLSCTNTSGELLWKREIGKGNLDVRQGESNGAAPSPSTDGKHVWAYFGTGIVVCFDFSGREIWRTNLTDRYGKFNSYFGIGTTPLLDGNHLYFQLLHTDAQLIVALNKSNGKEVWKHERKTDAQSECLHSYASPSIYRHDDQEFLLTHGADYIVAHNLKDGSEIWRCGGLQNPDKYRHSLRLVSSPVSAPGLIIVPSAKNGPTLALNPKGASGDITGKDEHYVWRWEQNTTDVPSPLIHDGLVYICRENGMLICIDAKSGEQVYKARVYAQRHRGSPVYADGKIYLTSIDGTVSVVKAGRKFEILAANNVEERIAASLAISGGTIYLRTYKALYAIRRGE